MKNSKQRIMLCSVILLMVGGLAYQNCGQVNDDATVQEKTSTSNMMLEGSKESSIERPILDALILKDGSRIAVKDSKKIDGQVILTLLDGSVVKLSKLH